MGLQAISLFSGAGGLDLAAKRAGIRTVCYVEYDAYAQAVLQSRIRDGGLDDAPIWDDVRTFDGNLWRGKVDCVFGGFPCQPHSSAGNQRGGADERNLWPDFLRIVRESSPKFVIAENVAGIFDTGYALTVLADLEESGYCATPYSSCACFFGAPHPRKRVFFMAHAAGERWDEKSWVLRPREGALESLRCDPKQIWDEGISRSLCGEADGLADRMDRIRLAGNGVYPRSALPFFQEIVKASES